MASIEKRNDLEPEGARPWSDREKEAMARACNNGQLPECPIDGATLACKDVSGDGGRPTWNVHCPKCGNQTYWQL